MKKGKINLGHFSLINKFNFSEEDLKFLYKKIQITFKFNQICLKNYYFQSLIHKY
jgi:hypothetical protein